MVQETHWPEDREYSNHDWHVTSTGCSNMHSGVLVMLARSKFQHAVIRKEAPIPGRALAVRIQQGGMAVYLINVSRRCGMAPIKPGHKEPGSWTPSRSKSTLRLPGTR